MTQRALRILLVEDDDDHALLTMNVLQSQPAGHVVDRVADGVRALEHLQNRSNPLPDLIVLDAKLPRMGGLELLRIIKADERLRLIPVVILTTSASEGDRLEAYHEHCNSYLVKPVTFDAFAALIQGLSTYWSTLDQGI